MRSRHLDSLRQKLLAAGRPGKPDDSVPYAFATRIMARLNDPVENPLDQWGPALWKSATACVAAASVLCAAAFFLQPKTTTTSPDLGNVFSSTLYAMTEQLGDLP